MAISQLDAIVANLVRGIIAPRTLNTYRAVWQSLSKFLHSLNLTPNLPLSADHLLLYIAHMHINGFAASTIASHCSAIGFVHTINSLDNPSLHPTVTKIVKRLTSLRPPDCRQPISIDLLEKLLSCLPVTCSSSYQVSLYSAMFVIAFFALLRISEFTIDRKGHHVIMLRDVSVSCHFISLTIRSFKHSSGPVTVCLKTRNDNLCPVKVLKQFLAKRGFIPGPLFAYPNGEGIQRAVFTRQLKTCIAFYPEFSNNIKSHSFRIGGATYIAQQGASDEQIRRAGRWRSNAFRAYIRSPC
jgi:hypothetical protein